MANTLQAFYGPNAGYALELYERYQQDPNSVDAETRAFFDQLAPPVAAAPSGPTAPALAPAARPAIAGDDVARVVGAARLARSIREFGHLAARIDPLGAPPPGDPMLDPATHGIDAA